MRIIKKNEASRIEEKEGVWVSGIRGIRSVISISKIRKINEIKKNWILNGWRLRDEGSNPHSKGNDFSLLMIFFFEKIKFKVSMIKGRNIIKSKIVVNIMIIYINLKLNYLIGS